LATSIVYYVFIKLWFLFFHWTNFSTLRFEKLIFDSGDASVKNVKV
jgi:hypothetical protein